MVSSEISSFPPGLRSWVHMDPVYSWPQSLLSPLYWRLVPIAWSLRKAFSCFQPTWVWGTMWGCLRLPWADSPPPYLLLPHHAAEGRPIKLAVSPSSTQEVRHSSSLSLEPQNFSRACPSIGTKAEDPLQKTVSECALILLSYGYHSWEDRETVLNWEYFLQKPLFCPKAFRIQALATQNTFYLKAVVSAIIPKAYFNTQRIAYLSSQKPPQWR